MTPASPVAAARRELKAASAALDDLTNAKTLDDAEDAWRKLLQDLNRVWTKLQVCCKHRPAYSSWLSPHAHARKKDMLLRYLHHARNSDEHTLTSITTKKPGRLGIGPPPGGGAVHVRSLRVTDGPDGTKIHYDGSAAAFYVTPPELRLERVFDRGEWYNPPTQHLGKQLQARDPVTVGELGFAWYDRLVDDAEKVLFGAG